MKMKTKLFKFQRTLISDFQMELNFVCMYYNTQNIFIYSLKTLLEALQMNILFRFNSFVIQYLC